jgi:S-adenosylmethionine synthetase
MQIRVVRTFADKELKFKMYGVGEIINLPDIRAKDAIERGLAVEVATAKVETKEEPTEVKKTVKKTVKKSKKKEV